MVVKAFNTAKKRFDAEPPPAPPRRPRTTLLTEIRDQRAAPVIRDREAKIVPDPRRPAAARHLHSWIMSKRAGSGRKARPALLAAGGWRLRPGCAGCPCMLTTESTDDAYVNGHVTFQGALRAGAGDAGARGRQQPRARAICLSSSDKTPYRLMVEIAEAAVGRRKRILSRLGHSRGASRADAGVFAALERSIEDVNNQVELLKSRVATLMQAGHRGPVGERLQACVRDGRYRWFVRRRDRSPPAGDACGQSRRLPRRSRACTRCGFRWGWMPTLRPARN